MIRWQFDMTSFWTEWCYHFALGGETAARPLQILEDDMNSAANHHRTMYRQAKGFFPPYSLCVSLWPQSSNYCDSLHFFQNKAWLNFHCLPVPSAQNPYFTICLRVLVFPKHSLLSITFPLFKPFGIILDWELLELYCPDIYKIQPACVLFL